jgi:hypothetical protein
MVRPGRCHLQIPSHSCGGVAQAASHRGLHSRSYQASRCLGNVEAQGQFRHCDIPYP